MNYRPLGSRILIDPIEITQQEKMVGSIEMAESAIILQKGKVLAVGRGEVAPQTGTIVSCECNVGDTVLFRRGVAYLPIRLPGEDNELMLVREQDIEAIV